MTGLDLGTAVMEVLASFVFPKVKSASASFLWQKKKESNAQMKSKGANAPIHLRGAPLSYGQPPSERSITVHHYDSTTMLNIKYIFHSKISF